MMQWESLQSTADPWELMLEGSANPIQTVGTIGTMGKMLNKLENDLVQKCMEVMPIQVQQTVFKGLNVMDRRTVIETTSWSTRHVCGRSCDEPWGSYDEP